MHNNDRSSLHLWIRTSGYSIPVPPSLSPHALVVWYFMRNYSRHSFRIRAATSASHNGIPEHFMRLVAGPRKSITATSVKIPKISDTHNLISNDWMFLEVHRCLGAAVDSLQSFPTTHSKNSKNQRFVFNPLRSIDTPARQNHVTNLRWRSRETEPLWISVLTLC